MQKMDDAQITGDAELTVVNVESVKISDTPDGLEWFHFKGPNYQKNLEEFCQNQDNCCVIFRERICDAHDAQDAHYAFEKGETHYRCNDPNCGCDVCIECFEEKKSGCEHPLSNYELTVFNVIK